MNVDAAHAYIKSLRKPSKRAYAEQYWYWLLDRTVTKTDKPEPDPSCLGYMAAQAVRMQLANFIQ